MRIVNEPSDIAQRTFPMTSVRHLCAPALSVTVTFESAGRFDASRSGTLNPPGTLAVPKSTTIFTAPLYVAVPATVSFAEPVRAAAMVTVPPSATDSPLTDTDLPRTRLPSAATLYVASEVSATPEAFVTAQFAPIVSEPFWIVWVPAAKSVPDTVAETGFHWSPTSRCSR